MTRAAVAPIFAVLASLAWAAFTPVSTTSGGRTSAGMAAA
jgi:hypothetical protein